MQTRVMSVLATVPNQYRVTASHSKHLLEFRRRQLELIKVKWAVSLQVCLNGEETPGKASAVDFTLIGMA